MERYKESLDRLERVLTRRATEDDIGRVIREDFDVINELIKKFTTTKKLLTKADKMYMELGYEDIYINGNYRIEISKPHEIIFIYLGDWSVSKSYCGDGSPLTLEEFKATYEKLKELGAIE